MFSNLIFMLILVNHEFFPNLHPNIKHYGFRHNVPLKY